MNHDNNELIKYSKSTLLDKIKILLYQRIYQTKLIDKLTRKIKKLKKALIIKKNFWNTIVFESCDMEILEFDSLIFPISKNIKRTENDMNESVIMLVEEKKKMSQIDSSYIYITCFFEKKYTNESVIMLLVEEKKK